MNTEIRIWGQALELRASEESDSSPGTLVGHAAVFNKRSEDLGGFFEVVAPGAFKNSLSEGADVRALVEHRGGSNTLGRTTSGTLAVSEDRTGLKTEIKLPDTQAGRDVAQLVERGDLTGMSFGFTVRDGGESWEEDRDGIVLRTLHDVNLHDVSVVAFPAYPDTAIAKRSLAGVVQARDRVTEKNRERRHSLLRKRHVAT